ncbi:hypothetical protein CC86DRAFT_99728 [Ophiobolus disseminans]|uniref:Uncharacterized protein n=1 Tax=Ophiobolus disseminans TaxID=1469910 RepID=A0A6A6ZKW9_9PLEO|nr:hypothetical protein CC86DRAFT_99728 [Ophiobolus disseminans]
MTALGPNYIGGFVRGLPVMFLDAALLWQRYPLFARGFHRVKPSKPRSDCLPTWCWTGWGGHIRLASWEGASDYVKSSTQLQCFTEGSCTIPLVEWYIRNTKESVPERILHQNEWFRYKCRFFADNERELPSGWTQHDIESSTRSSWTEVDCWKCRPKKTLRSYYTHDSDPCTEFWYPIPTTDTCQAPTPLLSGRYLSCRTQSAWFRRDLGETPPYCISNPCL